MRIILSLIVLTMASAPALARTFPGSVNSSQKQAIEAIEGISGKRVTVAFDPAHGTVRWLSGELGAIGEPTSSNALSWITEHRKLFRLVDPKHQLFAHRHITSPNGYSHFVFHRAERGIVVFTGELTVHVDPRGMVTSVTAKYPPRYPISDGSLAIQTAQRMAAKALNAQTWHASPNHPSRRVLMPVGNVLEMAWDITLMWNSHKGPVAMRCIVSAQSGQIIKRWSLIHTNTVPKTGKGNLLTGQTVDLNVAYTDNGAPSYILHDLAPPYGDGTRLATYNASNQDSLAVILGGGSNFVSGSGTFKDTAAVAAHHYIRQIINYYTNVHAWSSWDGKGGDIQAYVHFGYELNNAYWHGGINAMMFGDGDGMTFTQLAGCLDAAAHEVTHGVITATVDLLYESQSGALNEHLADFFANMVDAPNGSANDWLLAENCMGPFATTPFLRSLKDPQKAGQPSHAYDYRELPVTEDGDMGGVHINSGIPNKVSYLISKNIGRANAEKVYFELMRGNYITSTGGFVDFRNGWVSACESILDTSACNHGQGAFDQAGIHAQGTNVTCPDSATAGGIFSCRCPEGQPFSYTTGTCGGGGGACNGVPATGACNGKTLTVCVNGTVVTKTCEGQCSWSAAYGKYDCQTAQSCGDVPSGGICDGTQVKSCEGGSMSVLDCAQYGKTCANAQCVTPGESGCTPQCSGACGSDGCGGSCGSCSGTDICDNGTCVAWQAEACGSVTYEGQCDGETLSYCDENVLVKTQCTPLGAKCGFNDTAGYFECVAAPTQGCNGATADGECSGAKLAYCVNDLRYDVDCGSIGLACGMNPSTNLNDCIEATASACGDATYKGTCTENVLTWCEDEELKILECDVSYQNCEYRILDAIYDCVQFQDPPDGVEPQSRVDEGFCAASPVPPSPTRTTAIVFLCLISWMALRRLRSVDYSG